MDFVKKEWQFRDIISENELNRMEDGIEEGITKAEQAQQIANEAKATADDVQSELSAHASATTGVHGATSAATPNTLVQRDPAGRFKAAAPSASDDVARKAEVDGKVSKSGDTMTGPLTIRRSYPNIDLFDTDANDIVRLVYDANSFYVFLRDSAGNFVRTLLELSNDGTSQKVNGNQLLHAGNLPDPARLGQANVFTATQTIQGGQLIQKHSRPHHALVSSTTNEGIRTEYREDQKRLRWQSTDGNGGFVASLAYLDRETGELYITPSEHKVWHAGNLPVESGSWTPELSFGGSTAGITYTFRAGRYIRIANVVYWSFEINLSSKGSASGIAIIYGLPFAKGTGPNFYHAVGRASNISVPSGQWLSSDIAGTTVNLSTSDGLLLTSTEFANNSRLYASGFYFI